MTNCIQAAFSSGGGGGGATVTEVTDIHESNVTETETTLVTANALSITVPTITDGVCIVTANLCTTNDNSGSLTTTSLFDVTNDEPLTINCTSTSGDFNNSQSCTCAADGRVIAVYISSPIAGTAKIKASSMSTSSEQSCNMFCLGVG